MRISLAFRRGVRGSTATLFLAASILCAQSQSNSSSSGTNSTSSTGEVHSVQAAAPQATPTAIDPSGPATSIASSETMFDVMAALNACGYDQGLAESDPLRQKVRDDIDQSLLKSEAARTSRDRMCGYIHQHSMNSEDLTVASFISLALFLTPPPELKPSAPKKDLPPDAGTLLDFPGYLRDFASTAQLHVIWVINRDAYEAEVAKAHTALNQMLVQTDLYLKQPPPTYGSRRFLVIVEPLIAPGETNARVYGGDYIVVESVVNGKIDLKPVKHTYLRFILEPLIYARSTSIDALTPILELVQPSPLAYQYKSDILSLVTECMIRAIEAHTMDTGVPVYKIPAHIDRSQLAAVNSAENAYERKVRDARHNAVRSDMEQGFILTQYFYNHLRSFPDNQTTLQEIVGEMIYGMNVDVEKHRVQDIVFAAKSDEGTTEAPPKTLAMLDDGEKKLLAGDVNGAMAAAQQVLAAHGEGQGRAEFLLARAEIMSGHASAARQDFETAAKTAHDLRTIAWSHIYLGRLDDLQGNRDAAIAQYQAAMQSRDGKPDTRQAAESGLKAPFAPPHASQQESDGH